MTHFLLPLKLVLAGHVDHGKSTLIGRLLYDCHALPEGKFAAIQASCAKRGMPFEWSFVLDALQTERAQGITIDTTEIHLRLPERDITIIDAPGHKEFLKNMITGAARADAALLLIDAQEGISEQSQRHAYMLQLLGIQHIAVLINKMDKVGYSVGVFSAIEQEFRDYLSELHLAPRQVIPISAYDGENLTGASRRMPWYQGPNVLQALLQFSAAPSQAHLPLRLPVQDVYKFDERRIIAGRIESGRLKVGDTLLFSPSNTKAVVASLECWPKQLVGEAVAGQSIGITLTEPVFIERGQVASHAQHAPMVTNQFGTQLFWLGKEPLRLGNCYQLRIATAAMLAEVKKIDYIIDAQSLAISQANEVLRNQIAQVTWRSLGQFSVDDAKTGLSLSRCVIIDNYDVAGGGIIHMDGFFDQRASISPPAKSQNIFEVDLGVTPGQRAQKNGHFGGVLWFTGLSGSGKSTLAAAVQKTLFDKNYQVFALDGDNVRHGLNRDLGFSPEDRKENIRRVGEVAALMAQGGSIVICSFISPYGDDRRRIRAIAPNLFHNVYIKASLATCEKRDTKGLYQKARQGKITDFTGISAPYEEPKNPDLVIDTESLSVDACVAQLVRYVEHHFVAPAKQPGAQ